jgi:hypothetical protein
MTLEDSTRHALPGTESKSASGLTTPDILAVEKDLHGQVGGEKGVEQIGTSAVDREEYPTGSSLLFILISLVLSVFLVALDMVSR